VAKTTHSLYAAKARLSALVERAAAGEEVVITKDGKPMAKLVAYRPKKAPKRKPGGWEGKVWMAPDFSDPLPEELWNVLSSGADS
jgi:prevent-host-death family protein